MNIKLKAIINKCWNEYQTNHKHLGGRGFHPLRYRLFSLKLNISNISYYLSQKSSTSCICISVSSFPSRTRAVKQMWHQLLLLKPCVLSPKWENSSSYHYKPLENLESCQLRDVEHVIFFFYFRLMQLRNRWKWNVLVFDLKVFSLHGCSDTRHHLGTVAETSFKPRRRSRWNL